MSNSIQENSVVYFKDDRSKHPYLVHQVIGKNNIILGLKEFPEIEQDFSVSEDDISLFETEEEIEFIIKCIQTFKSLNNKDGVYDDIIEKVMDKVNIRDMKNKKKVIFKYDLNVNLTESHTFIIDESYEIDEEEYEIYEIYDDLEDKYGEPIIEVEEDQLITLSTLDMEIIN